MSVNIEKEISSLSFQRNQKISDLGVLFINMHHLINEFRPHQVSGWHNQS